MTSSTFFSPSLSPSSLLQNDDEETGLNLKPFPLSPSKPTMTVSPRCPRHPQSLKRPDSNPSSFILNNPPPQTLESATHHDRDILIASNFAQMNGLDKTSFTLDLNALVTLSRRHAP